MKRTPSALGACPQPSFGPGADRVRGDASGLLAAVATGPINRALNRFSDVVERMSSGANFTVCSKPSRRALARDLEPCAVLADQLARRPNCWMG